METEAAVPRQGGEQIRNNTPILTGATDVTRISAALVRPLWRLNVGLLVSKEVEGFWKEAVVTNTGNYANIGVEGRLKDTTGHRPLRRDSKLQLSARGAAGITRYDRSN